MYNNLVMNNDDSVKIPLITDNSSTTVKDGKYYSKNERVVSNKQNNFRTLDAVE